MKLKLRSWLILLGLGIVFTALAYLGPQRISLLWSQTSPSATTDEASSATHQKSRSNSTGKGGRGEPLVVIGTVGTRDITDTISAVGTLQAKRQIMLRAETSGRIDKILFEDGDYVKTQQPLFILDTQQQNAELRQIEVQLAQAQTQLKRSQELAQKNFISSKAIDDAIAQVNTVRAQREAKLAQMEKLKVLTPFAGYLGLKQVQIGDYVREGTDLVQLNDLSSLWVDFRVPETQIRQLAPKQWVQVIADAYPEQVYKATISLIGNTVDVTDRSVLVRAQLNLTQHLLKPGMFVRVQVQINQRKNVVVVPEEALVAQGASQVVYRVQDNQALRQNVKISNRFADGMVEVVEGIKAGDIIVLQGQLKLKGEKTSIRVTAP